MGLWITAHAKKMFLFPVRVHEYLRTNAVPQCIYTMEMPEQLKKIQSIEWFNTSKNDTALSCRRSQREIQVCIDTAMFMCNIYMFCDRVVFVQFTRDKTHRCVLIDAEPITIETKDMRSIFLTEDTEPLFSDKFLDYARKHFDIRNLQPLFVPRELQTLNMVVTVAMYPWDVTAVRTGKRDVEVTFFSKTESPGNMYHASIYKFGFHLVQEANIDDERPEWLWSLEPPGTKRKRGASPSDSDENEECVPSRQNTIAAVKDQSPSDSDEEYHTAQTSFDAEESAPSRQNTIGESFPLSRQNTIAM